MCLEHTKVCQTNIFQTYDIKKYDFETVLWTLQKKYLSQPKSSILKKELGESKAS